MEHFPRYKPMFWKAHEVLEALVTQLHQCYVDYFIQKIRDPIEKKLFYQTNKCITIFMCLLCKKKLAPSKKEKLQETSQINEYKEINSKTHIFIFINNMGIYPAVKKY